MLPIRHDNVVKLWFYKNRTMKITGLPNFSLIMFLTCMLSGCTNIAIYTNGEVTKSWQFGIVSIQVETSNSSTIVETKSIGVVKSPTVFNIGLLKESHFTTEKGCELVLFQPTEKNLESLIIMSNSICSTTLGVKNE